ncbi:cyd operon YbgE family protein [Pseudomonas gingeri]|uniref:Cyd operon YbgE family protein n=1 Tax=Pseudomonas gingeri TaxID=117681 RepID=A0A7Y8BMM7_9PSED|nr:cyd operon YbgE family protein [Pseudomonas gingeri]RBH58130.1 Cyd operon protein YbgE [Pseudomonas sp. MWU13-2860]
MRSPRVTAEAAPRLRRASSRVLSLLLAVPLSLILLIHPITILNAQGHYNHNLLMLVMWGVAAGYVHGVGFDPRARVWQVLFHPLVAWGLMTLGYAVMWVH